MIEFQVAACDLPVLGLSRGRWQKALLFSFSQFPKEEGWMTSFFLPLKILLGLRKASSFKMVTLECTPLIPVLGKQRRWVSVSSRSARALHVKEKKK